VDTTGEPLGARYSLRYAPSLATLAELAPASDGAPVRGRGAALLVGNPAMPRVRRYTGDEITLSALPGAEAEAQWVAGQTGATLLSAGAATEAEVKRRLPSANLIHLATHGYAYSSEARARDSFIALAPTSDEDGLLTVGEVLDELPLLSAELVVLSACQTGLGDLKQAEGTVGLQRAFLAKGARSVLVSLWSVSDEATEQLMRNFYTHWLGGASKAEALRRAQAEVRGEPGSRFHHPRYWAAFQLVGAS
jgi:CHAT domain-containing protein